MKPIYFIAMMALTSGLHAQTAPESTLPDDDEASLLLITGKEAQGVEDKIAFGEPVTATDMIEQDDEPEMQKTADEGIQIQVEKTAGKAGENNGLSAVKIYSPWPAKPIVPAPEGWKFSPAPAGLAPYRKTVVLGNGSTVPLAITPFVLMPVSDGLNAIRIAEPGYDPIQQYTQQDTVGSILQKSTTELEQNEKQAADAIRRLQLLLSSLPQQK
jgi:hypothetical protein